jgi:hypothetical protein
MLVRRLQIACVLPRGRGQCTRACETKLETKCTGVTWTSGGCEGMQTPASASRGWAPPGVHGVLSLLRSTVRTVR